MMNPINGLHLTQPQPKLMAIFVLVHSLQNSLILALGTFHPNMTSLNATTLSLGLFFFVVVPTMALMLKYQDLNLDILMIEATR